MRVSAAPSPEKRPAAKKKKLASTCSKSEATYACRWREAESGNGTLSLRVEALKLRVGALSLGVL